MKPVFAGLLAAPFLFLDVEALSAEHVTLRSRVGSLEVSGTLLGFDGNYYRVNTQYGELTVDGSGVLCEGQGCPSLTEFVAEVSISGSGNIGEVLMPALVEGFATHSGMKAEHIKIDETHFEYVLSMAATNTPVGRFRFRATSSR